MPRTQDLSEAIAQVGKDNLAGTNLLTAAIQNMAGALSGVTQHEPESEMTKLKSEISDIKSTLSELMDFLKKKSD